MEDEDTWPLPRYNPGSRDHLHALGVISITFANLQASIDSLYRQRGWIAGIPDEQLEADYFNLTEEDRVRATKALVRKLPRLCEGGRKRSRLLQLVPRLPQHYRSF